MPRKAKEARIWLRPARVNHSAVWLIKDRGVQKTTGFGPGQKAEAEAALRQYLENKPEAKTRDAYVYFLTAKAHGFPIKIGVTQNRFGRFVSLQGAMPYDLELLGIIPVTDHAAERVIHKRFKNQRLRGEWFERTPELMAYIEGLDSALPDINAEAAVHRKSFDAARFGGRHRLPVNETGL